MRSPLTGFSITCPVAADWALAGIGLTVQHTARPAWRVFAVAYPGEVQERSDRPTAEAIVQLLARQREQARFAVELQAALERSGVSAASIERALEELEAQGRVLVRAYHCADPHLADADLRVVGLVRPEAEHPQAAAVAGTEAVWQRWLGDYLANHRCT